MAGPHYQVHAERLIHEIACLITRQASVNKEPRVKPERGLVPCGDICVP